MFENVNEFHKIIEGKYTDNIPARILIVLCSCSSTAYEIFRELMNVKLAAENHEAIPSLTLWGIYDTTKVPDGFTPLARVNIPDNAPIMMGIHRDWVLMFLQDSYDMAGEVPVIELTPHNVRDFLVKAESRDDFADTFSDILAYKLPYWLPVEKFSVGMEKSLARGRIIVMSRECAVILGEIYAKQETYHSAVYFSPWQCKVRASPSWGYADGVDIVPEYDEGGKKLTGIRLTLTMGDNASQTIELFTEATKDNMLWTFNKTLTLADGTELDTLNVTPFIKISGYGEHTPVMYVHPTLDALGTDKAAIWEKFAWLNISWHSPNEWNHWSVLKDIKRRSILREILGEEEMRAFEADFTKRFGDVYSVKASAGYKVSVKISVAKLEGLDRDFDGQEGSRDCAAEFVASVIEALREMIGNVGGNHDNA